MGLERDLTRNLKLLSPLGPFWDHESLTTKCKSVKTRPLELSNVLFAVERDGRHDIVGLDLTEPVAILPSDAKPEEERTCGSLRPLSVRGYARLSKGDDRVYFRGDFIVMREDQLTPECLDYIVKLLCERTGYTEAAILGKLFPNGPKADHKRFPLVITIQGWKKVALVPSLSRDESRVRFILDLATVDRERHFSVLSLETHTFGQSQVYLKRYQHYLTITSVVSLHPAVPVWLRTPEWFIARYLELYRGLDGSRWGRLLGILDSGERSADAPEPGEFVVGTPTKRPRWLRTLSAKEVSWTFGSHIEWIILQFHCLRRHVIDIPSWLEFALSTLRARRANPSLARRDGYDGHFRATYEVDINIKRLVKCRNRVYPAPGEPAEDGQTDEDHGRDIQSSSSESSSSSDSDSGPDVPQGNIFGSDFNHDVLPDIGGHPGPRASSDRDTWREPSGSTSSQKRALPLISFSAVKFEQLDALTRAMIMKPYLDNRLQWHCPDCIECLDVMNLTSSQRELLTPDMFYESHGQFTVRNERRRDAVRRIWKSHGSRHLKERGVSLDATHPSNQSSRGIVRRLSRPLTPEDDDEHGDIDKEDAGTVSGRLDDALSLNTQRSLTSTSDDVRGVLEYEHDEEPRELSSPENTWDDEEENPFATEQDGDWSCPCRPCGYSYQREALLIAHFSTAHENENPLKCTIPGCKVYFVLEEQLRSHLRQGHSSSNKGTKRSRNGNGKKSTVPSRLPSKRAGPSRPSSTASSTGSRTFRCPVRGCSKEYDKHWRRDEHISTDHPTIYTRECMKLLPNSRNERCRAMFLSKTGYRDHVEREHGGVESE